VTIWLRWNGLPVTSIQIGISAAVVRPGRTTMGDSSRGGVRYCCSGAGGEFFVSACMARLLFCKGSNHEAWGIELGSETGCVLFASKHIAFLRDHSLALSGKAAASLPGPHRCRRRRRLDSTRVSGEIQVSQEPFRKAARLRSSLRGERAELPGRFNPPAAPRSSSLRWQPGSPELPTARNREKKFGYPVRAPVAPR
jgi:hypothetical protein